MARTLVGDKFDRFNEILNSPNQGQDFSTLAWRFNNLNSTAKMLLVGASSQNVPFIPISELNKSENTAGQEVYRGDYLINLNRTKLKQESPLELISPVPPKTEQNNTETLEYKPVLKSINNSTIQTDQKQKTDFLPVFREEKTNETINDFDNYKPSFLASPKPREILTPQYQIPEDKLFNLQETHSEPEVKEQKLADFQNTYLQSKYQEPKNKTNWSYPVEENYYEIRDIEDKKENPVGNLIKQAAKSAAVLSLLALLGLGTYNLYNSWQKQKTTDLEKTTSSLGELAEPDINPNNLNTSPSNPSSKTFFEEDAINSPVSPASEKGNYESVIIKPAYYQPTIKPRKPKQNKVNTYYKSKTVTPSINEAPKVPPLMPFDYTNIYDSSSEKDIDPNTYTGIKFPLEVSYTKSNEQAEADLNSLNNSSALPNTQEIESSNNKIINLPEAPTQFTETAQTENSQPIENTQKVERSENTKKVERVENNYPIMKSYSDEQNEAENDLTVEEKAILDSSDTALPQNQNTVPVNLENLENKQTRTTQKPNNLNTSPFIEQQSVNPTDSQLSQQEMKDLDENLKDQTFSVPILRSPLRQIQSNLENSPYSVDGSKSSSNITLPTRKYYSKPSKARINRTFSPVQTQDNNSQTDFSISKYQDQVQSRQNPDYSSTEAQNNDEITNGVYLRQSPYQNANLSSL